MKLEVKRFEHGTTYTIGRLYLEGMYECYTLEREDKNSGTRKPAIPVGTYKVTIDNSARFHRPMPHVLNVPGYEGIRIHQGNTDADTEGCILLGQTWAGNGWIGNSHLAFEAFFKQLQTCINAGIEVTLEISNAA